MHKFLNAALVLTVLISGFLLYTLEHSTRGHERQIAKIESRIADAREEIKMLRAEWSSLTRPDRLERLAKEHLKLQPLEAQQIAAPEELASKVPPEPIIHLEAQDADPIGDILNKMQ